MYSSFWSLSFENITPPADAAHARPFGHLDFLLEIALLVGDVNPVARAVGRIDQSVVGEIESEVADELLGHRTVRRVRVVLGIRC